MSLITLEDSKTKHGKFNLVSMTIFHRIKTLKIFHDKRYFYEITSIFIVILHRKDIQTERYSHRQRLALDEMLPELREVIAQFYTIYVTIVTMGNTKKVQRQLTLFAQHQIFFDSERNYSNIKNDLKFIFNKIDYIYMHEQHQIMFN